MKLLHVVASYLPARRYGGTIVSVHGVCRALARRGHDVHVFTTSVDGPADSPVPHGVPVDVEGVTVWYFRSENLRRIYRSPELGQAIKSRIRDFDALHTHAIYLWPLWTAARAARDAGVPYVVSPRGMLEKDLVERKSMLLKASIIGFVEKHTLEGAAAVHVTSRREAEEAASFGFHLRRVREIPNGVDLEPTEGRASEAIDAIASGPPFILFLGRINWKKGLDRLIAALDPARQVHIVIAGNDEDNYLPTLRALAAQRGVAEQITFAGPVAGADKAALLRSATALVLPSYSENFGNVVIEAMAAGRPVIVTPEVGASDLVRASGAGLIVDGGPEPLRAALMQLSSDTPLATAMGARGQAAAKDYSWNAVAARMEDLYCEIARAR